MRFFRIRKTHDYRDQTSWDVTLYTTEITKEQMKDYHASNGQFSAYLSTGITLSYYQYDGDKPDKFYLNSGHTKIDANYVGEVLASAHLLSKLPGLHLQYVLEMVTKGGWRQLYSDPRTYMSFLEKDYPALELAWYGVDIQYSVGKRDDGSPSTRDEYFKGYALNEADARKQIMGQFPERLAHLKEMLSPEVASEREPLLLNALAQWVQNGMPFSTYQGITQEYYSQYFTEVKASTLLKLFHPDPVPAEVEHV